jgi:hypothetical protein
METLRLRKIQQPSEVERLLEAFVSRGSYLPKECYQVRDPRELSSQLRRVLADEAQQGHVWACWVNAFQTWLFTCEMSLVASRERGAPVLKVNRYDETGELKETGTWLADKQGTWTRCAA